LVSRHARVLLIVHFSVLAAGSGERIGGDAVQGNNFGHPAFTYGDVNLTYDKITNIENLVRYGNFSGSTSPTSNTNYEEYDYLYNLNSNHLVHVTGSGTAVDRNYNYDQSGNVLTDDYRKMLATDYGRGNLPFTVTLDPGAIKYLYDAQDARVCKRAKSKDLGIDESKFYLRDAGGRSLGELNINAGTWEWCAFGEDRFARITPEANQQPTLFNGDVGDKASVDLTHPMCSAIEGEITYCTQQGYTLPDNLQRIELADGSEAIYMKKHLNDVVAVDPTMTYTVVEEVKIASEQQLILLKESGSTEKVAISYGELASSALESEKINSGDVLAPWGGTTPTGTGTPLDPATTRPESGGTGDVLPDYIFHDNRAIRNLVYYIQDHLGSTRITYKPRVTNCFNDNGQILATKDYELLTVMDYYPYGKILRQFIANAPEPYHTSHHERDVETGLDYRGARYYDSDIARFLSLDPSAAKYPSLSDYSYVAGNPLRYIDPDGKEVRVTGRESRRLRTMISNNATGVTVTFGLFGKMKVTGAATTPYDRALVLAASTSPTVKKVNKFSNKVTAKSNEHYNFTSRDNETDQNDLDVLTNSTDAPLQQALIADVLLNASGNNDNGDDNVIVAQILVQGYGASAPANAPTPGGAIERESALSSANYGKGLEHRGTGPARFRSVYFKWDFTFDKDGQITGVTRDPNP
jgi:RHS repeat-associated protein